MLARAFATLRSASLALATARVSLSRIEASPVWDGTTKTVKVTVPLWGEDGKALRAEPTEEHPKGKVLRETIEREVAVSRSSQYRKATTARRNAARRVARAEARFALACSEMSAEDVRKALRSLYNATA